MQESHNSTTSVLYFVKWHTLCQVATAEKTHLFEKEKNCLFLTKILSNFVNLWLVFVKKRNYRKISPKTEKTFDFLCAELLWIQHFSHLYYTSCYLFNSWMFDEFFGETPDFRSRRFLSLLCFVENFIRRVFLTVSVTHQIILEHRSTNRFLLVKILRQ